MSLVGELNLHFNHLSRLIGVEVQVKVINVLVDVRELDDVVDLGKLVLLRGILLQRELACEVSRAVPERAEIAEVEHQAFKQDRRDDNSDDGAQNMKHLAFMQAHQVLESLGDVFE